MIVAPVDPSLPMDDDNAMTVAIVTTTRETADLFAGASGLLAAAQALMHDWRHDCPEAFRQAVKKCEGWQP
jgi:hypothetical protein